MGTDTTILKEYSRFFDEQAQKTREWLRTSLALPIALALLLIFLLLLLKSKLLVWCYISLLYAITVWGIYRLRKAIKMTSDSAGHLQQITQKLKDDPTREEFLAFVDTLRKPGDDSNVPEAIGGLAHGQVTSGSLRVAANAAFATPLSELRVAAFVRTGLILGGLFGTVLFFALELTGRSILTGQLEDLLLGLRGALASTLSGILGSIWIGIVASTIGRRLEELIWETEAFLSSAVSNVLLITPVKKPLTSEADLWESLREEVAHLSQRVQEMFNRMADDAHAYSISLQAVSERLENLPAVHIPEQLSNLEQVVTDFKHGAEVIGQTVPLLVETVSALGVFAPARMLEDLQQLHQKLTEHQQYTEDTLTRLQQCVSQTNRHFENYEEKFSNLERTAVALEKTASDVVQQVKATEHVLSSQLSGVEHAVTEAREQIAGVLQHTLPQIEEKLESLDTSSARLLTTAEELECTGSDLQTQTKRLAVAARGLTEDEGLLAQFRKQLTELDQVIAWHRRAAHAPLMKLLLAPLIPRSWRRKK